MARIKRDEQLKKNVIDQLHTFKFMINMYPGQDFNFVVGYVRSTIDLTNKYVPELLSTIEGLKEISEIKIGNENIFPPRLTDAEMTQFIIQRNKVVHYLKQIEDYIINNGIKSFESASNSTQTKPDLLETVRKYSLTATILLASFYAGRWVESNSIHEETKDLRNKNESFKGYIKSMSLTIDSLDRELKHEGEKNPQKK